MMSGDWIKIEHTLPDKPEVDAMAKRLSIDHDAIVGKCLRWFIWLDQQSRNGHALAVTESFIDRLSYCPGFAAALREVGWLNGRDGHLSIPNFDRHNGQTAKNRALSKDRQAKSRGDSVTKMSRADRDESVTRIEKRREEKIESPNGDSKNARAGPRDTWMTPFADEWKRVVKGDMQCKKVVKVFSGLIGSHGNEKVLVHWRNYLNGLERDGKVEVASAARFAETFGQYAAVRTDRTLFGSKASRPSNPGSDVGSEEEWAARFEAERASRTAEASQEMAGKRATG